MSVLPENGASFGVVRDFAELAFCQLKLSCLIPHDTALDERSPLRRLARASRSVRTI